MKNVLEIIYKNELYDKAYSQELFEYFEQVYGFYNSQTENSFNKFREFLGKYSFDKLLSNDKYDSPRLLLFHSSDNYEFFPTIQDNGIYPIDEEIGAIAPALPFEYCEFAYNKGYDEDEIMHWEIHIQKSVIFTWLSQIWRKLNGANHGRVVSTLQNSVTSKFIFNDFSWHNSTAYNKPIHKSVTVCPHFNRNISKLELYKRVIQNDSIGSIEYIEYQFDDYSTQLLIADNYIIFKEIDQSYKQIRFASKEDKEEWRNDKEQDIISNGGIQINLE